MSAQLWFIIVLDVVVFAVILGMVSAIVYRIVQNRRARRQPPMEV
jgi:hypothetical protein